MKWMDFFLISFRKALYLELCFTEITKLVSLYKEKKERFNMNTGISAPPSPYSVFLADPVVCLNLTSLPMAPRLSWIW